MAEQNPAVKRAPATSRASSPGPAAEPYVVIFDGGSLGNPGQGYGSYRLSSPTGREIRQAVEFPLDRGPMTNNQAEYETLIQALRHLAELLGDRAVNAAVRIEGDSQLVLNQLAGSWKVKHAGLKPLHETAKTLLASFGAVEFSWHPRARSVRILGH